MAKINITQEDVLAGINACISINIPEPQYNSQSKERLSGKNVHDAIYAALVKEFNKTIASMNDSQKKAISEKIINNSKVRAAADVAKATKRKAIANKSPANLPSKLCECANPGDDLAELFICLKGNTKIRLSNGTCKPIEELVELKNIKIKGFNGKHQTDTTMTTAFKTQEVNGLLKITMEDGSIVECTPEHKFLMNGEWIEAKNLSIGDNLDTA